jgi:Sec-independent protein translocase protein TatA
MVYRPESSDLPQHGTPKVRLPEHVESIREALLRFRDLLPESRRKFFEKEAEEHSTIVDSENKEDYNVKPPDWAYLKQENRGKAWRTLRQYRTMTSNQADAEMERNQEVAGKAQRNADSKVNEANWSKFMSKYIFKEFDEVLAEATEYE